MMDSKQAYILHSLCLAVVNNPPLLNRWRLESIPWGDKLVYHGMGESNELSDWLAIAPQNWVFGLIRFIETHPLLAEVPIYNDLLAFGTALAGLPVMNRESQSWRKSEAKVSPFVRIWAAQHSKLEPRIESLM
jgi:hypothetical protein